jgi:hypothetical protein
MSSHLPPTQPDHSPAERFNPWKQLRSNKTLFFAGAGFLGAFLGDLVTEPFQLNQSDGKSLALILFGTATWVAFLSGGLSATLALAGSLYNRRPFMPLKSVSMATLGAIGGAISGGLIQILYSAGFMLGLKHGTAQQFFFQCFVWGLMGGTVGGILGGTVPNLKWWRAVGAGLVGGSIGCAGFLTISSLLPEVIGRLLGVGVMGAAIGLSIIVAERLAREASLEVIWAPNEITFINLGDRSVFIGGGREDDVFVRGFPPRHAGIMLKQGTVEYTEATSGRQVNLKDGSRLQIGKLTLVVHTDAKG